LSSTETAILTRERGGALDLGVEDEEGLREQSLEARNVIPTPETAAMAASLFLSPRTRKGSRGCSKIRDREITTTTTTNSQSLNCDG